MCVAGGALALEAHIAGQGEGDESSSRPNTYLLLTDSSWHGCLRAGILQVQEKREKKESHQEQNVWGSNGRKKGESDFREVNRQLQHSHLATGSYGLKQPRR